MVDILICGYGVVGQNIQEVLRRVDNLNIDICDKYKNIFDFDKNKVYDFCYICVDTPMIKDNLNDISEIINVLENINADIYILKSTVLPGTTKELIRQFGKKIVFSPEYYGNTQHCNDFDFNFNILGGNKEDCLKVQQMLQNVYNATHKFSITDSTTAELVKYMENSFLATKVSFCSSFWETFQQMLQNVYNATHKFSITDSTTAELVKYMENSFLATKVSFCSSFWETCNKLNINYEDVRELFILDPRINASHTFIHNNKPYWDSHCLNKDVVAIAETFNNEFLKNMISYNQKIMKRY